MNFKIEDEKAIDRAIHMHLDELLKKYRIFAFYGPMGVGKTTLISRIINYLGVKEPGASPTFSIVNEYENNTGKTIYHFDFYRFESYEEAFDIGIEEYWENGDYLFMEWPEKIAPLLPSDTVKIILNREEIKLNIMVELPPNN